MGKAGLAGLFTIHELKLAKADAESSPTLCHLAAPFDAAGAGLSGLIDKIKGGGATSQDVNSLAGQVDAVQSGSAADGVTVPDQVPTDSQIASGGN